jgi:pimeloyl-ACP methyl ester carboxylesterase
VRLLLAALAALALPSHGLHHCTLGEVSARCGTFAVPENSWLPHGRRIDLHVVVIPALRQPARPDAFTYLAGGPGGEATALAPAATSLWPAIHVYHDILLVDQRGTLGSRPGNPILYGTMNAVDDLEGMRVALGYRSLDLYGASYGATFAQAFLISHPRSVRTIVLDSGTLVSIPFYSRFAANGERALDAIAARCHDQPACNAAYSGWRVELSGLIRRWNEAPARRPGGGVVTGDQLAGAIQSLTLSAEGAALVPYVVTHAAKGDLAPLAQHLGNGFVTQSAMFWSISCNEPWVGLASRPSGPSYLDGYTRTMLARDRKVCSRLPARPESPALWRLPESGVPVLALVGGADPQDPLGNLTGLRRHFRHAQIVLVPGMSHTVGQYGCLGAVVSSFVDRGGGRVDAACARKIKPPPFLVAG